MPGASIPLLRLEADEMRLEERGMNGQRFCPPRHQAANECAGPGPVQAVGLIPVCATGKPALAICAPSASPADGQSYVVWKVEF